MDDWLGDDVLLGTRAHAATTDVRRFPRSFFAKSGKPSLTGHATTAGKGNGIAGASHSLLGSTAANEERVLREQSDKLRQHMVQSISGSLAAQKKAELYAHFKTQDDASRGASSSPYSATPTTGSHWKPYEIEVEALALAQLQRKVREAAHTRTRQQDARSARSGFRPSSTSTGGSGTYNSRGVDVSLSYDANTPGGIGGSGGGTGDGSGGAPRWGARRNYQDLMEAQTHANILLQEHQYALPHINERQVGILYVFHKYIFKTCAMNFQLTFSEQFYL